MTSSTTTKDGVNDNVNNSRGTQDRNYRSSHTTTNASDTGARATPVTSADNTHNLHRRPVREPLTQTNLSAHDAHEADRLHGSNPMQRWFMSTDDLLVRGRRTERDSQHGLIRYIDQMFETAEKARRIKASSISGGCVEEPGEKEGRKCGVKLEKTGVIVRC